ncbi:peptide chain release factor 1 [Deferribacterales bacterium RsTz2092]|nr:peptide chain release factor 1 [Deferribacterales bacterium]
MTMFDKLEEVAKHYDEVSIQMSDPAVIAERAVFQRLAKEHSDMEDVVGLYREWKRLKAAHSEADQILRSSSDKDMQELAHQEMADTAQRMAELEQAMRLQLLPKDPYDDKNIYLEIRAGTGGDEASLFAADLLRMYSRFADLQNWKVETVDANETGVGGYKEVVLLIKGRGAYSRLKYEGGGHRVQRIPDTEASGRIHTSACTVAVLPEADDVDVAIDNKDLRVDVYRSGGAGGQHVNTTDSAVRITHIPTGIVVTCQDERSQIKNKDKAMKLLKSKLLEDKINKQANERAETRKLQVGSGDRSERIRTYNFPQNRMTDHRINMTVYSLDRVMEGEINEILQNLNTFDQAEKLKAAGV